MLYTDSEIKFIHKCLKYFKKYNKGITHDSEGVLHFPKRNLGIEKDTFLQICDDIFNKAQKDNLVYKDIIKWGVWDCFDIVIIDTRLTIAKLEDNHYCMSFDYI